MGLFQSAQSSASWAVIWIVCSVLTSARISCEPAQFSNLTAFANSSRVFVRPSAPLKTEHLDEWFREALQKHESLMQWEEELLHAGRELIPGTPSYLEWLLRRSPAPARDLAQFALVVEDVALQASKWTKLSSRGVVSVDFSQISTEGTEMQKECPLVEIGPCRANKFRSFDGQCNNVENPNWGKASTAFGRVLPSAYADGILTPRIAADHQPLPSASSISALVHKDVEAPHEHISQMAPMWAQLVEQDISKSTVYGGLPDDFPISCCRSTAVHPECFPIIEANNFVGMQFGNATCLNYIRSLTVPSSGCRLGARQQANAATHYLDASNIYGAEQGFHSYFDDKGMLYMPTDHSAKGLPEELTDVAGCHRPNADPAKCMRSFAAKSRGHGLVPVTVLKAILMREHNRLAAALHKINPHWDSAITFQEARRVVAAQVQHITMKEFLPLVVGQQAIEKYHLNSSDHDFFKGYSMRTEASVDAAVSVAGLKFWHKLMDDGILHSLANSSHTVRLSKEMLQVSQVLTEGGFDSYLLGMVRQASQQKGAGVTSQLTQHWMQGPEDTEGLDLPAITIQQGRDHGVAGYNIWRKHCGLSRASSFSDFQDTISKATVKKLDKIYRSVEDVDLYTGGLSETPLPGALVGPVFACMLGRQFSRLRRGDRFWYENDVPPSALSLGQLEEIRKITLSRLICDNGDNITTIQPRGFLLPDIHLNAPGSCAALPEMDLSQWKESDPALNNTTNQTDLLQHRVRRQNFRFPQGNFRQQANVRQNRQLQPVNQFQNINPQDNTCGERSQGCNSANKFRTVSGFCNNLNHPEWGTSNRLFSRFMAPAYDDGVGEIRKSSAVGGSLPPVRAVRTQVLTDVDRPHPKFTTLLMTFGQYVDHDFTNTPMATSGNGGFLSCRDCNSDQTVSRECAPIRVPQGDPVMAAFDQRGQPLCLSFTRSQSNRGSDGRRQQLNQLTSYLDGSNLYGSSVCTTRNLRSFNGGRIAMTRNRNGMKDLLPQSTNRNDVESSECRSTNPNNLCFKSGDARSNEQPGLVIMHTIFAREHNSIADQLRAVNPQWNDQKLFDETRRIVTALLQHITYNEWLPRVVGQPVTNLFGLALRKSGFYDEYDDTCDATISNEFSTAAFRFGHSLVPSKYGRYDNTFNSVAPSVNLFEHFSRADLLYDDLGVDKLLIGFTIEPMQSADFSFSQVVANRLFQEPRAALGTDLISINIQRGRDHGLPGYNAYRERCNMTRARTFDDLLGDIPKFLVDKFAQVYRHVDDIDLFAGGTSELPVVGGLVGPTFACIIAEQMLRVRKCDRFWYETSDPNLKFSSAQLAAIRKVTMAHVVCKNSDTINRIQRNVFDLPDTFQNSHIPCDDIPGLDVTPWQQVTACTMAGSTFQVGETKRISPCKTCTCTTNGPDCRSLNMRSCADLEQDFSREEILADDVCKVQCIKEFSDSTDSDNF
ncbi:hypothetical protein RvY_05745 [Ramazzottius varieornatus]|uniref:Peroxidase n=1 Tax=Ramazzottius varieornatus TaxID=947166 RepID=A0A1D1V5V1_RAMVA|nr:hypothetical protein RvY_05745 [Ramazzottius varieornatus]